MKHVNRVIFLILIILGIFAFMSWYIWFQKDKEGLPTGSVSYSFINSRQEAKLYYQNSQVLSIFGQPEKRGNFITSPERAFAGAVLASPDTPDKIYKWYHDWLLDHGWQENKHAFAGLLSTQVSLQGYSRGSREAFYVAMDDPKQLGWTLGKQIPTNSTIFEIYYSIAIHKK